MEFEAIISIITIISINIAFFELRFRQIHKCVFRIENRFDKHIEHVSRFLHELSVLKGKLDK